MTFEQTDIAVRSLAIFSKLRNDVGVSALTKMMRLPKKEEFAELWATYYNALAETAELEGTTRTVSQESRERIRALVSRTVSNISNLYGGTAEIQWTDFAPPLINNPNVCL